VFCPCLGYRKHDVLYLFPLILRFFFVTQDRLLRAPRTRDSHPLHCAHAAWSVRNLAVYRAATQVLVTPPSPHGFVGSRQSRFPCFAQSSMRAPVRSRETSGSDFRTSIYFFSGTRGCFGILNSPLTPPFPPTLRALSADPPRDPTSLTAPGLV